MERLKLVPDETCSGRGNDNDGDIKPSKLGGTGRGQGNAMNFLGGPSSWYGASTLQCFFKVQTCSSKRRFCIHC
jgi:exosome complex component RRP45